VAVDRGGDMALDGQNARRPIPPRADSRATPHPIEDPALQADVRAWTALLLQRSGSCTVVIELHYYNGRCDGVSVGGSSGKARR
jgi:hypothetical protein